MNYILDIVEYSWHVGRHEYKHLKVILLRQNVRLYT